MEFVVGCVCCSMLHLYSCGTCVVDVIVVVVRVVDVVDDVAVFVFVAVVYVVLRHWPEFTQRI